MGIDLSMAVLDKKWGVFQQEESEPEWVSAVPICYGFISALNSLTAKIYITVSLLHDNIQVLSYLVRYGSFLGLVSVMWGQEWIMNEVEKFALLYQ